MACYTNLIVCLSVGMALSGCSDSIGHLSTTSANPPRVHPTLVELNGHGLIPHEGHAYQYAINTPCTLDVMTKLNGSPYGHKSINLAATQFERFDLARGLGHAVRVTTDITHPNVFTALSDEKANRVMDLLDLLSQECSAQK